MNLQFYYFFWNDRDGHGYDHDPYDCGRDHDRDHDHYDHVNHFRYYFHGQMVHLNEFS